MRVCAAGVVAGLVASAVAGAARAQGEGAPGRQRVAVVKLGFDGSMSETARDLFARRLVEGLAAAQFEVLAGREVRQRLAAAGVDVGACHAGECLARAAHALDVSFLVIGAVEEHDKTYEITLELVNGRSGVNIGTNRERCEICGIEEATEKVGLAASALRARLEVLARTPARFIIRTRPVGARLAIDGADMGRTPVDHELPSGLHKLALSAEGYDPLERTVTAVSGVDETLDLDLVPLPTKFPYRLAGWSAVAVGVAALAVGIWAVTTDGHEDTCAPAQQDGGGHCPTVRDTRALGAALMGVGAASATLGVTWIYFGSAGAPRAAEGGTPGRSLAGLGVNIAGRF